MDAALNDIAGNLKNYVVDYFVNFKRRNSKSNSITYLEYRLDKFFKKEKRFLKNKLLLYYDFNKKIIDIPVIPYYVSLFYQNIDYIVYCVKYSEWDEIMEIYKNVVKANPNYKNSRLTDPKHVYDRRYLLLTLYYIFIIYIYVITNYLYKYISNGFYFFIDTLDASGDSNLTFLLAFVYLFLVFGVYYGGIPFIIFVIRMFFKALYYIFVFIYYVFYFIGLVLYYIMVGVTRPIIGGHNKNNRNNKDKLVGGDIYNNFDNFINDLKDTFDENTANFLISIVTTILGYILPSTKTVTNILDNPCKSTSNIEKMLAKHNNIRNTDEPINLNKKVNRSIKSILPTNVQNNEFVKCMYKENKKKPKSCN
jgi:hypothetical protein